ncbi:hypothetical protein [Fusobacterium polymorphum]
MRDGVDIPGKKREIDIKDVIGEVEANEVLIPNSEILSQVKENYNKETNENTETKKELTDEEKQKIKEETGWSDEIVDSISSMKEYEIYKNAGLEEREINGEKEILIPPNVEEGTIYKFIGFGNCFEDIDEKIQQGDLYVFILRGDKNEYM